MTRRALITGGLSGIGRAAAERLATDGIEVITADVAPGADIALDVSDADAATAAVENLGQIDILVNSAGIVGPGKPLWATTAQEWHEVFAVNLHGSVNMCRAAIPGMLDRGWGRIVNLASMAGKDGNPHQSAYSASKAAVIGFTKSLGKELATTGVIVNAIAPAVIATGMNARTAPDILASISSLIPMGRLGRPEEVAELIAWLTSDKCSFSTGAVYDISGGRATY
ncbi:MAG: SDR family NAD(P)-dependent oxidoreductase [Streptosporangiaceae bacterium]